MAGEYTAAFPVQLVPASNENESQEVTTRVADEQRKRASRAERPVRRLYIEEGNMHYDGSSEEEHVPRKKRVTKKKDYFTGGQPSSDESDDDEHRVKYSDPKFAFAARAKQLNYKANTDAFFKQKDQLFRFGNTSIVLMRLGFDKEAGLFKVYLKKENGANCKASVLQIFFSELNQVIDYFEKTLEKIRIGFETGDVFLKPLDLENYVVPTIDTLDFWRKDGVFYTESMAFRARCLWQHDDKFQFVMNNAIDFSSFPRYFGPKIRLSKDDLVRFIEKARALQAKLPSWEELMDM